MGKCDKCEKEFEKVGKCGECKVAKYCGKECQQEDWSKHKKECVDQGKMWKKIMAKLTKRGLYRHVNGDTLDNRIQNLRKVTPQDALLYPSWTVDAVCALNEQEFALWEKVRGNQGEFKNNYVYLSSD